MHVAKTEQAPTSAKSSETTSRSSSRDLKVQLRKMSFSEGEAAVAPTDIAGASADGDGKKDGDGDGKKKPKDPVEKINDYQAHIDAAATEWGVSAASIKAQIYVESKGDVNAGEGKSYRGLMQVGSAAWTTVANKKGWDWDFESDWDDPYRNIMIGVGYRLATEKELSSALKGSELNVAEAEKPLVNKMCYNAGAGTISMAMKAAKSTKVADFSKNEHLEPAICHYDIQSGYRKITLAKWLIANAKTYGITETKVEDVIKNHATKLTETWFTSKGQATVYESADSSALASKVKEITQYGPKIAEAMEKFPETNAAEAKVAGPTLGEHVAAGGVLKLFDGTEAVRPELADAVREVQERLRTLRFRTSTSGEYSALTENAVKTAQRTYGLQESGSVDGATWEMLQRPDAELQALAAQVNASVTADFEALKSALADRPLTTGDGEDASPELQPAVRALQRHVLSLGFACRVDGRFTGRFMNCLRQAQASVGMAATGVCDLATWQALTGNVPAPLETSE